MTRGNDHARHPGIDAGLARLILAGRRTFGRIAPPGLERFRPPVSPDGRVPMPGPAGAEPVHAELERERARLARELHDEFGALLAAARLELHALVRQLGARDAAVMARIAAIERTLQSGVDLKARLVEGLRPSTLSLLGLAPALEEMLLAFAERFPGEVDCDLDDAIELDEDAALTLYRCAQESLTNITKHASAARSVQVSLRAADREAILAIEDDGPGCRSITSGTHHHGLTGLRERVQACGGLFVVASRPGAGMRVVARLPLRLASAAPDPSSPARSDRQPSATRT